MNFEIIPYFLRLVGVLQPLQAEPHGCHKGHEIAVERLWRDNRGSAPPEDKLKELNERWDCAWGEGACIVFDERVMILMSTKNISW